MNRKEFLEILRSQLAGQMQEGKAAAHTRYYEDYIQSQVRGGRSEQEVLQELGDPHLIAKTLIDTDDGSTQEDTESILLMEAVMAMRQSFLISRRKDGKK